MQAIAIIGCFFYIDRSRKVPPTFFIGEPQGLPLLYNKTEKECISLLKLLFVDEMKPRDIAKILNCSAQYVSNQKQKGLKYLRKTIVEGGDIDG